MIMPHRSKEQGDPTTTPFTPTTMSHFHFEMPNITFVNAPLLELHHFWTQSITSLRPWIQNESLSHDTYIFWKTFYEYNTKTSILSKPISLTTWITLKDCSEHLIVEREVSWTFIHSLSTEHLPLIFLVEISHSKPAGANTGWMHPWSLILYFFQKWMSKVRTTKQEPLHATDSFFQGSDSELSRISETLSGV